MARIYQEGFETPLWDGEFKMNQTNYGATPFTANTFYHFCLPSNSSSTANTEKYIRKIVYDEPRPNSLGKYSLKQVDATEPSSNHSGSLLFNNNAMFESAPTELYLRMYLKVQDVPTNIGIVRFYSDDGESQHTIGLFKANDIMYIVGMDYGNFSSSSIRGRVPIPKNTWFKLDYHVKIASSSNGGIIEAKIDDVLLLSKTCPTYSNGNSSFKIQKIVFGYTSYPSNKGIDIWWDDIAVNDTNGDVNNSWCEDGSVLDMPVTSATTTQFTPSSGTNIENINKVVINDNTYNSSQTVGHVDLYKVKDLNLDDSSTINAVTSVIRGKYSDTSGGGTVSAIYKKNGTITEQDGHLLRGTFDEYSTAMLENKSASELEDIEIGYKLNAWSGLDG